MKLIATYLRDMEPSEAPPDYSSAGGVFPPNRGANNTL